MPQLRYLTSGESHGKSLIGIIDGIPAGLSLEAARDMDPVLAERQRGYGRSHRQTIEHDKATILSGVRFGITTGAPIAIEILNKDSENWDEKMSVVPTESEVKPVTVPRPGHADLAGAIKYRQSDIRNILERASARETAMRVAIGAVASKFLRELGIASVSFVRSIGDIEVQMDRKPGELHKLHSVLSASELRMFDSEAEKRAKSRIDAAKSNGDTLGGVVEAHFIGAPIGIGSFVQWDRKLDGLIAQAVMSIQAVKAVEIGGGISLAKMNGSQCHDSIEIEEGEIVRNSNNAGGMEGGMTDGMPIVVRAAMKPISTLMRPLPSVDLATGESAPSHIERSDVCAVPSLAVIVEYVVAFTLASALLDTCGGDTMDEVKTSVAARHERGKLEKIIE
ncbi:MAG: chorismate synthase [Bacteroidota bacterium]|nr:chorismate synthase [Bacteroidota bacterium]